MKSVSIRVPVHLYSRVESYKKNHPDVTYPEAVDKVLVKDDEMEELREEIKKVKAKLKEIEKENKEEEKEEEKADIEYSYYQTWYKGKKIKENKKTTDVKILEDSPRRLSKGEVKRFRNYKVRPI